MSTTSTKAAALGPHRRAPEQKQARLLAAAEELFAEHGFDSTSTLQIARQAGVSEGILFHHFGSKKGLFLRLAEDYARAAAAATMPADPADLSEETIVRAAFDFADANPGLYRMLIDVGGKFSELGVTARSEIIVATIRTNLERGMHLGQVRRGDAQIMAELQFAVVDGAYNAWHVTGDKARRNDYINEAITCMRAMLAPAATVTATD